MLFFVSYILEAYLFILLFYDMTDGKFFACSQGIVSSY